MTSTQPQPSTKRTIDGKLRVPTWFVAQSCRIKETQLRAVLRVNRINMRSVKAKNYKGEFKPAVFDETSTYRLVTLSDIEKTVARKYGHKQVKWLRGAIERALGVETEEPQAGIKLRDDDLLAIACVFDRLHIGVTSYKDALREVKSVLWKAGVSWSKVPIDFKRKLASIGLANRRDRIPL